MKREWEKAELEQVTGKLQEAAHFFSRFAAAEKGLEDYLRKADTPQLSEVARTIEGAAEGLSRGVQGLKRTCEELHDTNASLERQNESLLKKTEEQESENAALRERLASYVGVERSLPPDTSLESYLVLKREQKWAMKEMADMEEALQLVTKQRDALIEETEKHREGAERSHEALEESLSVAWQHLEARKGLVAKIKEADEREQALKSLLDKERQQVRGLEEECDRMRRRMRAMRASQRRQAEDFNVQHRALQEQVRLVGLEPVMPRGLMRFVTKHPHRQEAEPPPSDEAADRPTVDETADQPVTVSKDEAPRMTEHPSLTSLAHRQAPVSQPPCVDRDEDSEKHPPPAPPLDRRFGGYGDVEPVSPPSKHQPKVRKVRRKRARQQPVVAQKRTFSSTSSGQLVPPLPSSHPAVGRVSDQRKPTDMSSSSGLSGVGQQLLQERIAVLKALDQVRAGEKEGSVDNGHHQRRVTRLNATSSLAYDNRGRAVGKTSGMGKRVSSVRLMP
ncbi:unnamed protein product [Vitrella brassicaformis CCMP3155]|uniref:Uncharacterized protein n=2 Tax=Vitrella brassicaformis TaxID=1169539 RepID=A0A0G4EYN5_VITBC|nr:unnamed protein product [Vitrella brassicaformis CCMP3155]|eukprot:CEM04271.1 unnamed protein product [Vitrella brassicaformis CCMP3155]